MKECFRCQIEKNYDCYYKNKSKKDGYSHLCKECQNQYFKNTQTKRSAYSAEYRRKNKEKWNDVARQNHIEDPRKQMIRNARKRAREKGFVFSLGVNDLTIPNRCPYLDIPLIVTGGKPTDNSPSLDRIDSTIGYISSNVEVVSHRANKIKNDGTSDEHFKIYFRLSKLMKEKSK